MPVTRIPVPTGRAILLALAFALFMPPLLAQHGHPLVGTWSGYLNGAEDRQIRALFQLEFNVDQSITGSLIANGQRFPLASASLDPDTWTVTITAQGPDRQGNAREYRIMGAIENLDSPTERTLVGTWQEGGQGGDFRVVIN